jgi:hypothetical protein
MFLTNQGTWKLDELWERAYAKIAQKFKTTPKIAK